MKYFWYSPKKKVNYIFYIWSVNIFTLSITSTFLDKKNPDSMKQTKVKLFLSVGTVLYNVAYYLYSVNIINFKR